MGLADGLDLFGTEVGGVVGAGPEGGGVFGRVGLAGLGVHGELLVGRTGYLRAFPVVLTPGLDDPKETLRLQRAAAAGLCAGVVVEQLTCPGCVGQSRGRG